MPTEAPSSAAICVLSRKCCTDGIRIPLTEFLLMHIKETLAWPQYGRLVLSITIRRRCRGVIGFHSRATDHHVKGVAWRRKAGDCSVGCGIRCGCQASATRC